MRIRRFLMIGLAFALVTLSLAADADLVLGVVE